MQNPFSRVAGRCLERRLGGAFLFVAAFVGLAFLTRLALTIKAAPLLSWNPGLLAAFLWGALFDLAAAGWWSLPPVLALAVLPRGALERPWWRRAARGALFLALCALLFTAVSEWLFWDEFDCRFNFIAVDYLVYTREVSANINESYPMALILGGIALTAAGLQLGMEKLGWIGRWLDHAEEPAATRWRRAALWTAAAAALGLGLNEDLLPSWKNNYNREIARNGPWSFVAAFRANKLDYENFYPTLPAGEAVARVRNRMRLGDDPVARRLHPDGLDLLRVVQAPAPSDPEQRLNVIQITVESLSAEFLGRYGSKAGWTPNLDELSARSLVFENFYATGTRTDRGMEALSLSVPPTPGRSLVKRPDNAGLFTLGSVFRTRGYDTSFIYGGNGYFDNMNVFFGGNGYRVLDRSSFEKNEVTFANAWGACDEDLFGRSLREADAVDAAGKPFFQFLMTTSNHRPFTYPEGKIDLPSQTSRRAGGVKYTDYAIGRFLRDAATHPWYNRTVFVIVADHCASSAGRTELPVRKYHIPLIIFAPGGQIAPGVVKNLASQVDYAPTLLALLNWSYPSRFFGWNVLAPDAPAGRALIGTYQKLGLYDGENLAVLAPVRQSRTYQIRAKDGAATATKEDAALRDDAIAYYESASWLEKNGRQSALPVGFTAP